MTDDQPSLNSSAADRLVTLIGEGEDLVEAACEVLRDLLNEARSGDATAAKQIGPLQSELTKLLRQARDTERSYHDWRIRTTDHLGPGEIDFDEVRHAVRERLDRLREKVGSRGVPDDPE